MKNIGDKVLLNGKTYEIVGVHKRSYLLKGENGKTYKCGPEKLDRMENNLPPKRRSRTVNAQFIAAILGDRQPQTEADIIARLRDIECELSPENLHCDGEISHKAAMAKYRVLKAEQAVLEQKLGRKLTDTELFG